MMFASMLLTSAMLSPVQKPTEQEIQFVATRVEVSDKTAERGTMAEHVEILRQILRRKLHRPSSNIGYQMGTTPSPVTGVVPPEPSANKALWTGDYRSGLTAYAGDAEPIAEGVYLPGYGVVMTVTLPPVSRGQKPIEDKPASKPLSDWESAQMELRGERPAITGYVRFAETSPPPIRDAILRVLAENGRHLTHLREDERVTVVVTFRDSAGRSMSGNFFPATSNRGQPENPSMHPFSGLSLGGSIPIVPGVGPVNKAPSSAHDYELLADLHLKQQQYQAAVEAYAKALSAYQEEAKGNRPSDYEARMSQLYSHMAQAHLGQGQQDSAIQLLQRAKSLRDNKPATAGSRTKEPAKLPAPEKLIVTATKRQLDQVAQGKITFEEFTKSTSVEEE